MKTYEVWIAYNWNKLSMSRQIQVGLKLEQVPAVVQTVRNTMIALSVSGTVEVLTMENGKGVFYDEQKVVVP